ncbi:MAG: MarR family winged helix-turn-helix transcriptional regulator [Alphaproteobacteria bacterium]
MDGPDPRWRATNWIMICAQLIGTRGRHLLAATDLPPPQFIMLNHFSHHPEREQRVADIAAAFEVNQPAVTKTLQKLVTKGFLEVRAGEQDRRARFHKITSAGLAAHAKARDVFGPDLATVFADWSDDELAQFIRLLDKLKVYLDDNRTVGGGDVGFENAMSFAPKRE